MSKDNALQRIVVNCGLNWKLDRRKRDISGITVGTKYGKWTTLAMPYTHKRKLLVRCRCECGLEKDVLLSNLESEQSKQCETCGGKSLRKYSPGDTFNWWVFLRYSETDLTKAWFRCRCGFEGEYKTTCVFRGKPEKCASCRKFHGNKKGYATFWSRILSNAKRRGLEVGITWEDAMAVFEKQGGKCALTGVDITLPHSCHQAVVGLKTASLDRTDNTKGYIHGNIQWVHKKVNRMKSDFTMSEFIYFCRQVARTHADIEE